MLWIQIHWILTRIQGYVTISILKKIIKNNFREKLFSFKKSFLNYKKIIAPEEQFSQLSLWWWIYVLNFTPFASILSYIYLDIQIRIRIHNAPEYGSGSTTQVVRVWYMIWYSWHTTGKYENSGQADTLLCRSYSMCSCSV